MKSKYCTCLLLRTNTVNLHVSVGNNTESTFKTGASFKV